MPDREAILGGLTNAANAGVALAIAWHVVAAVAILAVVAGWRPSNRLMGGLLALPLASVSVSSWLFDNPFNGSLFAALALTLIVLAAVRGNRAAVSRGQKWSQAVGVGLLTFGWLYPHFLRGHTSLAYLVAAPLGLIPCPTLSAVIGAAILSRGLCNRAWSSTLAIAGGFYALFGVARLGVWIDVALLVGAVTLVAVLQQGARPSRLLPVTSTGA